MAWIKSLHLGVSSFPPLGAEQNSWGIPEGPTQRLCNLLLCFKMKLLVIILIISHMCSMQKYNKYGK